MHVFDSVPVLIRGGNSLWTFVCEITLVVVCNTLTEWLGMKGIFYHISTYPFFMPFYTEFFNFYLLYISFFRWGLRPQTPVIHFCPIDCTILAAKTYFHTLCRIYTIRNDESIKIYYSSTVITQHKVLHIYKRGFGGEAPEKNFGVLNNPPPY